MCSTVRPKRTAKVIATPKVVSIMVSMDDEARHRFAQRANQAAQKKEALRKEKITLQLAKEKKDNQGKYQQTLKKKQQHKEISYWLFSASFAELFKKLTTGR